MSRKTALVGVLCLAAAGCYATVDPEPVGYAEVDSAPVGIETYPSVVYEGHLTYFYGGRWYYRNGSRWAYYRNEPDGLKRQRASLRRAPAADREERVEAPEHR